MFLHIAVTWRCWTSPSLRKCYSNLRNNYYLAIYSDCKSDDSYLILVSNIRNICSQAILVWGYLSSDISSYSAKGLMSYPPALHLLPRIQAGTNAKQLNSWTGWGEPICSVLFLYRHRSLTYLNQLLHFSWALVLAFGCAALISYLSSSELFMHTSLGAIISAPYCCMFVTATAHDYSPHQLFRSRLYCAQLLLKCDRN